MSYQQGLSGLSTSSQNLEVIGNNIANANTYGEKSSRAEFADMYAAAMSGAQSSVNQAGIGVKVASVSQQFTQGTITPTGNPLDLAINGNGFFQVLNSSNQTNYTRNGQFKVDANGYIINNQGEKLLGYGADAQGNIVAGQTSPLQLPTAGINPKATTTNQIQLNLDSTSARTDTNPFSPTDQTTYNNATSVTMYDSQGNPVPVTYYFQKTAPVGGQDTWNVYATANGTLLGGATPTPVATLSFNSSGILTTKPASVTLPSIPSGTGSIAPTVDFTGATEFGASFAVTNMAQNGYAPGSLTGVTVDTTGTLVAQYSNGQTKDAGQLVLATFRNAQGLATQGGNTWAQTASSGGPTLGVAGSGNMGALNSGSLEESNVDLTSQLVDLITAQREYQANAQTIKTVDQTMQTLVSLS